MPSLLPVSQPSLLPGQETQRDTESKHAVAATIAMPSLAFPLSSTVPPDRPVSSNPAPVRPASPASVGEPASDAAREQQEPSSTAPKGPDSASGED
jgi:hypothetical protein